MENLKNLDPAIQRHDNGSWGDLSDADVRKIRYEDVDVEVYPALFISGYASPLFYSHIFRNRLERANIETFAIKTPWLSTGDIRHSALVLSDQVEKHKERLRIKKLNLIGHSLGGIIIRYYLQKLSGWKSVKRAVYLATPHHGVYLAYAGYFTKAGRQLIPGSDLLRCMEYEETECKKPKCLSIYSQLDYMTIPHSSCFLECAFNKKVFLPAGHLGLLLSKQAIEWTAGFLEGRFDHDPRFAVLTRKVELRRQRMKDEGRIICS